MTKVEKQMKTRKNPCTMTLLLRNSGRALLTAADVGTIIGPIAADWNDSHIFNQRWPSHARFHGVVALGSAAALSAYSVWRLWAPSPDCGAGRDIAAAVPLAYWGSFFPAALVKGTGVEDLPHRLARVVGIPINMFVATTISALTLSAWLLDRRLRSSPA
jgi:hypothetical protein